MRNKIVREITGKIFDIKRYAIHDGPGIRTTVFMRGCPLDCWWCHNPEGKSVDGVTSHKYLCRAMGNNFNQFTVSKLMDELLKDSVFYDESSGGVTFSGGEPMLQLDFLESVMQSCRESGIHTTLDTSGFASWDDFERIMPFVNLYLYDIKFINNEDHEKFTGQPNDMILANLDNLVKSGGDIYVSIPMIPEIIDNEENLAEITEYLTKLSSIQGIRLLSYNKLVESKIERLNIEDRIGKRLIQTRDDLSSKARVFEAAGFKVSIGG